VASHICTRELNYSISISITRGYTHLHAKSYKYGQNHSKHPFNTQFCIVHQHTNILNVESWHTNPFNIQVCVQFFIYQNYKGWVYCDICVTQNYCLLSNHRRQSHWRITFWRERSTCRCVTILALHEFRTKFWNVMLLKIILFSSMSSLASAYTCKHELILFYNALMINLSIKYIFYHVCVQLPNYYFP
jgi:hypothetical protein